MAPPVTVAVVPATLFDRHDILALDVRHTPDSDHGSYLDSAIRNGTCWVARIGDETVGCAVWNREFFGKPFIWHLVVHPAQRRRGAATALIGHIARLCAEENVFTSTNDSNEPMHRLLARLGFIRCGLVDRLDPGDPEVFYVKLPESGGKPERGEGGQRHDH
jgi:GNAT superfamily N-acetyltransferase